MPRNCVEAFVIDTAFIAGDDGRLNNVTAPKRRGPEPSRSGRRQDLARGEQGRPD